MKTPFFSLLVIGCTLLSAPLSAVVADDTSSDQTNLAAGPSSGTDTDDQGEHHGRWKKAFAQLDLTDSQKAQIKQIRATVTDRKERRQQVMAVLTQEQKEKLKELIQQYRSEKQGASGTTTTPSAN